MRVYTATRFVGTEIDLRKARRYSISAVVSFCWDSGNGFLHEGHGTTLNVSAHGVFVRTGFTPRVGGQLELEICMKSPGPESKAVLFHGEGRVVRTIQEGPESGFAAEVLFQTETADTDFSDYHDTIH